MEADRQRGVLLHRRAAQGDHHHHRPQRPRSGECQCRVRCVVAARWVAAVFTRRPRRDSSSAERRRDRRHEAPAWRSFAHVSDDRRFEQRVRLCRDAERWPARAAAGRERPGTRPRNDVRSRPDRGRRIASRAGRRAALAAPGPRHAAAIRQCRARRARCRRRHVRARLLCCLGATAHRRTGGETTPPADLVFVGGGRRTDARPGRLLAGATLSRRSRRCRHPVHASLANARRRADAYVRDGQRRARDSSSRRRQRSSLVAGCARARVSFAPGWTTASLHTPGPRPGCRRPDRPALRDR